MWVVLSLSGKASWNVVVHDRGQEGSSDSAGRSPVANRSQERIKPIHPDKYYLEAGFTGGDRVIFRIEGETIYFIDVVSHDDIAQYARPPTR